jgi:hypothetical protein
MWWRLNKVIFRYFSRPICSQSYIWSRCNCLEQSQHLLTIDSKFARKRSNSVQNGIQKPYASVLSSIYWGPRSGNYHHVPYSSWCSSCPGSNISLWSSKISCRFRQDTKSFCLLLDLILLTWTPLEKLF